MHTYFCALQKSEEDIRSPGVGVTGICGPPDEGAGNRIMVFWRSCVCSQYLSHCFRLAVTLLNSLPEAVTNRIYIGEEGLMKSGPSPPHRITSWWLLGKGEMVSSVF